jgi:peptidylprolyl isomerase
VKGKANKMAQAKQGDTVNVHYTGKLSDGTEFDTSTGGQPLQFTIGEGKIIPGFEQAVIGMNPGDTKNFTIPSEEAYGPHRKEMLIEVDRKQMPADLKPVIGQHLEIQKEGRVFRVTVFATTENSVTLDANHPLAGKDLVFDIQFVDFES